MLKRIGVGLAKIGALLPTVFLDLIGLVAAGLIAYGAWLIYPPAGFITGGVLLLIGTLLVARR